MRDAEKNAVIQRAFPRTALIGYQTKAFILSFFRNVISESNQIDSLKNGQKYPKFCKKKKDFSRDMSGLIYRAENEKVEHIFFLSPL